MTTRSKVSSRNGPKPLRPSKEGESLGATTAPSSACVKVHHPYGLTTPCSNCPFRNDAARILLRPGRTEEIERSLIRAEFPCHKTTTETRSSLEHVHCAGALILLEKLGRPSQMMRISARLGLYDPSKLNMEAPVFDSFEEMARANGGRRRRRR